MARVNQFCVVLENRPGQLAKLSAALARAKVNIQAISVADTADCCLVRFVAEPVAKARQALKRLGAAYCQQPVVVVRLPNEPGQLAVLADKLARAGVNIDYLYGSAAGAGQESIVVLRVDNPDKAQNVLKR